MLTKSFWIDKYYNMDQVVAQALSVYARIVGQKRSEASRSTLTVSSRQERWGTKVLEAPQLAKQGA